MRQSGTPLRSNGSLSKGGNARLRKELYMSSISAILYNPLLRAFYNRLLKYGKKKMVALIAVMRKLLHIIFGLLKHQEPFKYEIKC